MVLLVFVAQHAARTGRRSRRCCSRSRSPWASAPSCCRPSSASTSRAARSMMARHGVLVRHLSAIENLGSMDVLCTDKTGTLTEGVVQARGRLRRRRARRRRRCSSSARCNAALETGLANPLDEAILAGARSPTSTASQKLGEIPFDFVRKRVSVVVRDGRRRAPHHQGRVRAGARRLHAARRRRAARRARRGGAASSATTAWSAQGIRVLAVAHAAHRRRRPRTAATTSAT